MYDLLISDITILHTVEVKRFPTLSISSLNFLFNLKSKQISLTLFYLALKPCFFVLTLCHILPSPLISPVLAKKTTTGTPPHHTTTRCTLRTPKKAAHCFFERFTIVWLPCAERRERHTPAYKVHRQTLWSAVERDHTRARILNRNDQDLVPLGDDVCAVEARLSRVPIVVSPLVDLVSNTTSNVPN